jgi:hypothetical protein
VEIEAMDRRRTLIEALVQRKIEHDWQSCSETAFRILYGLPVSTQLGLAQFAIQRYLRIFQRKWPAIIWPAQLLNDIGGWLISHGRSVPPEPDEPQPADSAFLFSFDALVLAASYPNDQLILASSCMAAVCSAINAMQCNVWMADDPEGVELWMRQAYAPGRSVAENRPALAVAEREWEEIANWLIHEEVWQHPDTFAVEEIEGALARWKEHEMLLIVPHNAQ